MYLFSCIQPGCCLLNNPPLYLFTCRSEMAYLMDLSYRSKWIRYFWNVRRSSSHKEVGILPCYMMQIYPENVVASIRMKPIAAINGYIIAAHCGRVNTLTDVVCMCCSISNTLQAWSSHSGKRSGLLILIMSLMAASGWLSTIFRVMSMPVDTYLFNSYEVQMTGI